LSDTAPADALLDAVSGIEGFEDALVRLGASPATDAPTRAAAADFILEGLCALRKIGRTDHGQLFASPPAPRVRERQPDLGALEDLMDDDLEPSPRGRKKKPYN
jgi:hypothetical protein